MKKILSYILGGFLGLLIIAPPIDYTMPVMVNSFHWLYLVCATGLFGFFLLQQKLNIYLKILVVYLLATCFISQAPASSFNAYVLIVLSLYLLIVLQKCDFKIVIGFIEAAFWFEVLLCAFQLAGMDKLLCFDRAFRLDPETMAIVPFSGDFPKYIAFGTVMQYMRFASMLVVMAPFLIIKNKFYIIPITIMCALSESSTFAMSLVAGALIYGFFQFDKPKIKVSIIAISLLFAIGYAVYDWGSFRGAIIPANGGRLTSWWAVLQTWVLDTSNMPRPSPHLVGPFSIKWFLFGHGMDTFLPLFPIYKHDLNPFPQAHNDWLQILWEIGSIGFSLIVGYCAWLVKRLFHHRLYPLLAGCAMIATNMFFSFPMRITQTMFLIVAYIALCEKTIKNQEDLT